MRRMIEIHAVVDQDLCGTTGQCMLTLPAVFRQREPDGIAEVCVSPIPLALHAAVRLAASQCPVAAIRIVECDAAASGGLHADADADAAPARAQDVPGLRKPGEHDGTL